MVIFLIFFQGDFISRGVAKNLIKRYNQRVLQLFPLSLEPTPGSITPYIPLFAISLSNLENCRFRRLTLPHLRVRNMQMSVTRRSLRSFRSQLYTLNAAVPLSDFQYFCQRSDFRNFPSRHVHTHRSILWKLQFAFTRADWRSFPRYSLSRGPFHSHPRCDSIR